MTIQAQHEFIATLKRMITYWMKAELTQGDGFDRSHDDDDVYL